MTLLALFLIEIFCYRCLLATAYCTFSQTNHSLQSGHWCSPSGCSQFFSIWTDILNFLKHLRWNSLCLAFLTTESVMQRLRQALCIVDILEAVHSLPKVHYDLFSLRWSSGGGFCLDINNSGPLPSLLCRQQTGFDGVCTWSTGEYSKCSLGVLQY